MCSMSSKKAPVSYYGGKKNMLSVILPLIPEHKIYTESFFGGGAVFFAKVPSEHEVINDRNAMVMNFYQQVKQHYPRLKQKIEETLFSRSTYTVAKAVWQLPHLFSKSTQAWAFYVGYNQGFAANIGSWGFDKYGKRTATWMHKKLRFDPLVVDRLARATIENDDGVKVIKTFDTPDSFHYIDPPYINTDQGSYKGYTTPEFESLLRTLQEVKGKFLLSSFESEILGEFVKANNWYQIKVTKKLTAYKGESGVSRQRTKIEVLTANYPI